MSIFQGPAPPVGEYCGQRKVKFECLADPDTSAYRAYGLTKAGIAQLLSPKTVMRGAALYLKGMTTGRPHEGQSVAQMPGTFVIDPDGSVLYAHYNSDPSDNANLDEVKSALIE